MRLEKVMNHKVLEMAGRIPMRKLVLTPSEIATLEKARKICAAASDALGETGSSEGPFFAAEAWLAEVLS